MALFRSTNLHKEMQQCIFLYTIMQMFLELGQYILKTWSSFKWSLIVNWAKKMLGIFNFVDTVKAKYTSPQYIFAILSIKPKTKKTSP